MTTTYHDRLYTYDNNVYGPHDHLRKMAEHAQMVLHN